jgi:hypothetical protein
MPPHLHRRPPLRQPMSPPARVLLLPPHHAKTRRQPNPAPHPPLHLPPAAPRRPFRDPAIHRRSPPAHRRQRNRSPPCRPPPLRTPDRQPQPPQTPSRPQCQTRASRVRRRDHHRPRTRQPRPTHRSLRENRTKEHSGQTHRAHHARRPAATQRAHPAKRTSTSPAPEPATIPTLQATADNLHNPHQHTKTGVIPPPNVSSRRNQRSVTPTPNVYSQRNQRRASSRPDPERSRGGVEGPPHFAFAVACSSVERNAVKKSGAPPQHPNDHSWLLYPIPASTPRI